MAEHGGSDHRWRVAERFPQPSIEQWREAAEQSLRGRSLETLTFPTREGLDLRPLYTAEDLPQEMVTRPPGPARWEPCIRIDHADPPVAAEHAAAGLSRGASSVLLAARENCSGAMAWRVEDIEPLVAAVGAAPLYLDGGAASPALAALVVAAVLCAT